MRFCLKHNETEHVVFLGEPSKSPICGVIGKLESGLWEWFVRTRNGAFDVANSRYKPLLVRSGYANHRELALRYVIDYIKSGDWN